MNKSILWISPYAPYDKVGHAGGKIHNFYVKQMHAMGTFDITLLTLCCKRELKFLDLDKYQIKNHVEVVDGKDYPICCVKNGFSLLNPFQKYCHILWPSQREKIMKMVKGFRKKNREPDIVILQWTMVVLLLPQIRRYFPNSKYVAIEEDVTYLSFERKYRKAKADRLYRKYLYHKMKDMELRTLDKADLVVVNNVKDAALLRQDGFNMGKVFVTAPYYDDYRDIQRNIFPSKDIIFYGAMNRSENEESVLWFIENVMPLLTDTEVRFVVVGSGPSERLKKRESEKVKIVGFVQNVAEYFSDGLCLAAPLQMGAGIKIKILEAFSAGIPVLTNDIGIEGIPARDGKEYLHCETPQEYAAAVRRLLADDQFGKELSQNEKLFMQTQFDYHRKVKEMSEIIGGMG